MAIRWKRFCILPEPWHGNEIYVGDDQNVDGGGKWRYVYCVEYQKDCPIGGLKMQFKGGVTEKLPMHCITVRCIMDIHAVMSHILPVTGRWTTL